MTVIPISDKHSDTMAVPRLRQLDDLKMLFNFNEPASVAVQVMTESASSAVQDTQTESLATCLRLVAGDVLPLFPANFE